MRKVLLSSFTAAAIAFAGSASADCGPDHAAMSASLKQAPAASVAPTKEVSKPVIANEQQPNARPGEAKISTGAKKNNKKSETIASAQAR